MSLGPEKHSDEGQKKFGSAELVVVVPEEEVAAKSMVQPPKPPATSDVRRLSPKEKKDLLQVPSFGCLWCQAQAQREREKEDKRTIITLSPSDPAAQEGESGAKRKLRTEDVELAVSPLRKKNC